MRKLILNSDDYGYSRGINHAVIDTYQEGILRSTTLMTNTPGINHAIRLAKMNKGLGIGVHLVMTFLKPLCKNVPSLVDENGNFHRPEIYLHGDYKVEESDLYREWNAQIKKVIRAGIQPTHLDSHHHAHTYNETHLKVFLNLAREYNLPVRGNYDYGQRAQEIQTTDYFEASFDEITTLDEEQREIYLKDLYEKIKQNGSTEIMCHVGYLDEYLLTSSSFTETRVNQVSLLIDSKLTEIIQSDETIQLSNFRDL